MSKICNICKKIKGNDDFHNNFSKPDGLSYKCKGCTKEYSHKSYLKNKEKRLAQGKEYVRKNKDAVEKQKKQYRLDNIEHRRKIDREYYYNNKEKKNEYNRKYSRENRDSINKNKNKWWNKKYIEDGTLRIKHTLRARLSGVLKGRNKSASTMELVGCSIEELITHLQSTADNNYPDVYFNVNDYNGSDWHIDHVKPCNSFDLTKESEQKECFNYKNLQILSSEDNLVKGCTYEY